MNVVVNRRSEFGCSNLTRTLLYLFMLLFLVRESATAIAELVETPQGHSTECKPMARVQQSLCD